ncbi:GntR family transcriptional regulator [uncultured Turicimonas sp.]|uniref:FadR/GntR family transcriptional regulator n=1 Tax=uncultured Turicimonas sp. TaxID=1918607 RepID=UPI0028060163|nr:GntR family transcriptional regulator [uncultured Turicimonas sp.]
MIQNLHKTLGSTVFEDLFQKIESGFYPEGSKLPAENELVSIYGVSRPIVRNALQALREQGYIESTKGLGSFVTRNKSLRFMDFRPVVAQEDMLRCYEYRAAFEGVMAAQAALRRNAKDCVQLQKSYEEVEKLTNSSPGEIWEADIRFHETIAQASHNRFFYAGSSSHTFSNVTGHEQCFVVF